MKLLKFRPALASRLSLVAFTALLAAPGALLAGETHREIAEYVNSTTCMDCHSNRHRTDLMNTSHWTWNHLDPASGQELGKKNVINNFCVAVPSNEARCTSCHIGVGWRDMKVKFDNPDDIDCLDPIRKAIRAG